MPNIQPSIDINEHSDGLNAKKVVLIDPYDMTVGLGDSANPVKVDPQPLTVVYAGTKTVPTGTAETIASSQVTHSVTIKALSTNTASVFIGGSGVTTSGFELLAGESVSLDVSDINLIYCISGSASQVIRYIAV